MISVTWILPVFALVLGTIVFAFGIAALIQEQQETGASHPISSIASSNGLGGTIDANGVAIFHMTTAPGILMSNSEGGIELALPQKVTSTFLVGFPSSPFSGEAITASDTMESAFQKTLTLNGTPLTGFQPFVGTLDASDTVFSSLQKLQGTITFQSPYYFCISDPTVIFATNVLQDAWATTNLQGSLVLAANLLNVGSALFLRSFGQITVGATNPSLFLFRFLLDNQSVNDLTSTINFPFTGAWNFLWEMIINIQPGNVANLQGQITLTIAGNPNEFSVSTATPNVNFVLTNPHSVFLQASVQGGASNQILITGAVGTIVCNL